MSAEQIDAEKLEAAVKAWGLLSDYAKDSHTWLLVAAARAHLSTLPRVKEVPVSQWATFTADGEIWSSALSEGAAREEARKNPKVFPVLLTGTAKVRA